MNCKPGDLAIVIRDAHGRKLAGMLVEVLHHPPIGRQFTCPDGVPFEEIPAHYPPFWVVKFAREVAWPVDRVIFGRVIGRRLKLTLYACLPDAVLRPLPGPESFEDEEAPEELPCPPPRETACNNV